MRKLFLCLIALGFSLQSGAQDVLTPEGGKVLCNVRTVNLAANKGNSNVWSIDLSNSASMMLAGDSANETSARWSPDGKWIYYLNDAGGTSSLWRMKPDGTSKVAVSKLDKDINAFGIAPSGNKIWLTIDTKVAKFKGNELYPDLPKTSGRVYDDPGMMVLTVMSILLT